MKSLKEITLVKLGGSVITDKKVPYVAKTKIIKRLAKELRACPTFLIIAHGSGSFGHTSAAKFGGKKGYKTTIGIAKVARDAMEINRIVMDILINEGISAVSLRPMSMIMASSGKISDNFFGVVEEALNQGLVPVVYGDVVLDKSTIFSGETILSEIGIYLNKKGFKMDKIIEVGETNGVYDDKKDAIKEITKKSWPSIKKFIYESKSKDVTGGMQHKIEEALKMVSLGFETLIINGQIKNELSNALSGKEVKGTVIK
jgi:isopentenyl phosphate kinase